MKRGQTLQLVSGGLEAFLAIPILGGLVIIFSSWSILGLMLVLHIVTLAFAAEEKRNITGSIIGIVASVLGWIPFLGWALHLAAAITLLITGFDMGKK